MTIEAILERAQAIEAALGHDEDSQQVARHLRRSVIRPLAGALDEAPPPNGIENGSDKALAADGDALWQLALDATRLRITSDALELQEATAALQELALGDADADTAARLTQLRELGAQLPAAVQSAPNGPYLVTNAGRITDWLGQEIATRPQMALCRCGGSASKPFCDGSHVDNGFTDAKDPDRVPDRRDTYSGQQVTILDNRGICQHSGFCTDRLATVFRADTDPFVAPSGGRMDEIIRAVRACPSGALSYALDENEARAEVDQRGKRERAIEVSKDGPYRITGGIALKNSEGHDEHRNRGASREHYALCRCGHSRNKPFCSGMHWYVEFKDPVRDPDDDPTIFEWAGGLPALTRMTRIFYEKYVPADELLAPVFANMAPDHPERVAKWLAEVFGGPKHYSEEYGGYTRMISQHLGKALTEEKRARWVALIMRSAEDAGLPADPEFRSAFGSYIEWGSRLALGNSQPGAKPPERMPMPHWDWHTAAGPPGGRVHVQAAGGQDPDPPVRLPDAKDAVSFETHVKTFFRQRDRQSMLFAFDLWAFDDVKANAPAILERLRNGSMPCDGPWPADRVDAFKRWIDTGTSQ